MPKVSSAEEFIERHQQWKEGLELLREILLHTELEETIKWGVPYYTWDGKNVVGIAAFKNHMALWFPNGVFLDDPENMLVNAQEGITKAGRQLRFSRIDKIDKNVVQKYVHQAIENQKAGKEWKAEKETSLKIPPELEKALSAQDGLEASFNKFPPYKKKEFADYISEAKRDATKENRLKKIIPMINNGVGLHDKYR